VILDFTVNWTSRRRDDRLILVRHIYGKCFSEIARVHRGADQFGDREWKWRGEMRRELWPFNVRTLNRAPSAAAPTPSAKGKHLNCSIYGETAPFIRGLIIAPHAVEPRSQISPDPMTLFYPAACTRARARARVLGIACALENRRQFGQHFYQRSLERSGQISKIPLVLSIRILLI